MLSGWYQVAYERDVTEVITPISAGGRQLMLVRRGEEISTFDAICPHMGANLAIGGELCDDHIVCPFHHFKINLGNSQGARFSVSEYQTLTVGGMVFALLTSSSVDTEPFSCFITKLDSELFFVPGIRMLIDTNYANITENAFDSIHFQPIHGVLNRPELEEVDCDESVLKMTGIFELPPSPWYTSASKGEVLRIPFTPQAFSPGLVVSHMGGEPEYWVVTSALPQADNSAIAYVSIGVYPQSDGSHPKKDLLRYMLDRMRENLNLDAKIWENMPAKRPFDPTEEDNGVVAFRKYCSQFDSF